jgi:hypothetical protein
MIIGYVESGARTALASIVTLRRVGPSLVIIAGFLVEVPTRLPSVYMISTPVLSPTASSLFSTGALVQLQPGFMSIIFRVSVPTDFIQKVWDSLDS